MNQKKETYQQFITKHQPKLTTDDCYTPDNIYKIIHNYFVAKYNLNPENIVRPFWPGNNYKNITIEPHQTVLDNPPFSILAEIIDHYITTKTNFIIFAPELTILTPLRHAKNCNHILTATTIEYHNGAKIKTGFITNYGHPNIIETNPELGQQIRAAQQKPRPANNIYPANVTTPAKLGTLTRNGIKITITKDDAEIVPKINNKRIFGNAIQLNPAKTLELQKQLETIKNQKQQQ